MHQFELRRATNDDYNFLYRLHVAAMKDLIVQVWGWDDGRQEQYFSDHFDPTPARIIVVDGQDAGVVAVVWGETDAFIANIEILPEYQGRGLGAAVVAGIIEEANMRGMPIRLQVLKINPARRLYDRFGFVVTGETETHFLIVRPPG